MRVVIIGAAGMLGKYLLREWKNDEVVGLDSAEVDIRDAEQVRKVVGPLRPEWVVLTAAYTDVDGCESNADLAFDTNCTGAMNVAETVRETNSHLLFLSTDYVFDGTKTSPYETNDAHNPLCVYGRSKSEAEKRLSQILPEVCVVRTSWLFGIGGKCFPDTILKLAATQPELEVVNDQRGCPTYARDLARAIIELSRQNAAGVVHVTNAGDCTWFDLASEIVRLQGLKTIVRPTTSEKFVRRAARPKYSVLSAKSLTKYGIRMPNWQEALSDYLAEREAQSIAVRRDQASS